jgi:hypothetical protein
MRITIELTEAEGRATTIRPEGGAVPEDAPAMDGGPPPEALLIALGAVAAGETTAAPTERPGADAGGPPAWLVDVVTGGAGRPS